MANSYIRRQFSDTVSYTDELSGSITNSATSFTLKDGSTFPTGSVGPFTVTIDPGLSTEEKVLCASRSGSSVTVQSSGRGFGGTTAIAHSSNASVIHTICAQDLDEANQAVVQTIGKVTTAGDLLYGSGANALARLGVGTANQVLSSSGTAPQWSTLLGLIEDQFTAGGQIIQGTGNGSGQLVQLLAAIEAVFTANNQILIGTGSGTGTLSDILAALSNKFTAAGQVPFATGSGAGEVLDLLSALETKFASAGQLIVGTGSGTGELLAKGSSGTVLTVGGADSSGLEWISPLTANPAGRATQSIAQSMGTSAAQVTNTASDFLKGGVTYASNQFTVPVAGVYQCQAQLEYDSSSKSVFQTFIYHNGSAVTASVGVNPQWTVDTFELSAQVSDLIVCSANDTLSWGGVSSAGPISTLASNGRCRMSVFLVSQ